MNIKDLMNKLASAVELMKTFFELQPLPEYLDDELGMLYEQIKFSFQATSSYALEDHKQALVELAISDLTAFLLFASQNRQELSSEQRQTLDQLLDLMGKSLSEYSRERIGRFSE